MSPAQAAGFASRPSPRHPCGSVRGVTDHCKQSPAPSAFSGFDLCYRKTARRLRPLPWRSPSLTRARHREGDPTARAARAGPCEVAYAAETDHSTEPRQGASGCGVTSNQAVNPLEAMRQEVVRRMSRGERFTDVEDCINSSDVSVDGKAALWLLGWSYMSPGRQRREANAHLAAVIAATPPPTLSPRGHLRSVG